MFHRLTTILLTIALLAALGHLTAAEPADDASAGKTAVAKTSPAAVEAEKPAAKPPAAAADPPPKPKPEQVSYEYVMGVLRALTEGSERRYAAMEEQIDRLKARIDVLNRSTESLIAEKETAKVPPAESKVPPAAPPAKHNDKGAAATSVAVERAPGAKPPSWVGTGLQRVGNDYHVAATIGPYSRPTELEAEWPVAMQGAVDCYARRQLGSGAAGQIHLSEAELRGLIRQQWEVVEEYGAGPMKTRHVLLVFEPAMQTRVRTLWEGAVIARRLEYAAAGLTSGLLLLGILFACLKLDHTTAGAYRIRLVLAGVFLTGALAAGTTAAVQLLRPPPAETRAAESAAAPTLPGGNGSETGPDSSQVTVAGEPGWIVSREKMDATAASQRASDAGSAASLPIWLGAAVGLAGVLLLLSVGKKPAVPDALKETAVHEVAIPYEPVRHSSGWGWVGVLLALVVLLLASVFVFTGTSMRIQSEPASTPAGIEHSAPATQPAPADSPQKFREY